MKTNIPTLRVIGKLLIIELLSILIQYTPITIKIIMIGLDLIKKDKITLPDRQKVWPENSDKQDFYWIKNVYL